MAFLQLCPTIESRLHLTDLYIKLGMWTEVENLLDSIEIVQDYTWLPFVRIQESILSAYTRAGSLKTKSGDADLLENLETHIGNNVMRKGKLIAVNNIIAWLFPCPEINALKMQEADPPAERKGLFQIKSETQNDIIKVFPNPAGSEVNVQFSQFNNQEVGILIIRDIMGKSLIRETIVKSGKVISVSIENLPQGVYFIEVRLPSNSFTQKFIKE